MKKAILFLVMLLLWAPVSHAVSFGSAGKQETKTPQGSAAAENAFAIELYREFARSEGNLFFSPSSVETALSMTMAGAKNKTQQQIADLLHVRHGIMQHHADQAAFDKRLKAIQKKGSVEIAASNSIWPQAGYQLDQQWLDLLKSYYGTSVVPVDYVKQTETARKTINSRVEKDTKNRIRELLMPGIVDPMTRITLVNAVYFKGTWQEPFEKKNSVEKPFYSKPGSSMKTTMMMRRTFTGYADLGSLQVLELPYKGEELSMIILLPKNRFGLAALESDMTADRFSAWTKGLQDTNVDIELPKFRTTGSYRLEETLANMGMTDAFNKNAADLTGMTKNRDRLYIGAVVHKSFIDVNEEGTEAAAATAVLIRTTSAGPMQKIPVFRADHPFIFAIRENSSGKILFMGRFVSPVNE